MLNSVKIFEYIERYIEFILGYEGMTKHSSFFFLHVQIISWMCPRHFLDCFIKVSHTTHNQLFVRYLAQGFPPNFHDSKSIILVPIYLK